MDRRKRMHGGNVRVEFRGCGLKVVRGGRLTCSGCKCRRRMRVLAEAFEAHTKRSICAINNAFCCSDNSIYGIMWWWRWSCCAFAMAAAAERERIYYRYWYRRGGEFTNIDPPPLMNEETEERDLKQVPVTTCNVFRPSLLQHPLPLWRSVSKSVFSHFFCPSHKLLKKLVTEGVKG